MNYCRTVGELIKFLKENFSAGDSVCYENEPVYDFKSILHSDGVTYRIEDQRGNIGEEDFDLLNIEKQNG